MDYIINKIPTLKERWSRNSKGKLGAYVTGAINEELKQNNQKDNNDKLREKKNYCHQLLTKKNDLDREDAIAMVVEAVKDGSLERLIEKAENLELKRGEYKDEVSGLLQGLVDNKSFK